MLSTNVSQMQQYQDMINRQQQQQIGPPGIAEEQIYQVNAEDPNQQKVERTQPQGMPRGGIFQHLFNNPSSRFNPRNMLIQTQGDANKPVPAETTAMNIYPWQENANEAQGAQILRPYQPDQPQLASSRHYPEGHPDDQEKYGNLNYQRGLGSLFNNPGGPRQPTGAFENQFSELQNQMGGFGEQFTGLETSIGGLGESITSITDRLDSIEQGIKGLKTNDTSQAYTRMNWQPFSEWGRRRN